MYAVAFDTETKGFDWWGDQLAFIATTYDSVGIPLAHNLSQPHEVETFVSILRAADAIIAHNLSFDVHQVRETVGFDILNDTDAVLWDTDLMARVYWPEGTYGEHGGFGLKNLAKVYVDPYADVEENELKEYGKKMGFRTLNRAGAYFDIWEAYPSVIEKYALKDAEYTYRLWELLHAEHERAGRTGDGRFKIWNLEQELVPVLIRAEQRGVLVDPLQVNTLRQQYRHLEKQLHGSLAKQLGEAALGGEGSVGALIEALQSQGVPLYKKTDNGQLRTDKNSLEEFAEEFPVCAEFLEHRHVQKFLSTYIEPMIGRTVVHPDFRQIGAWTGRMSCARPNMQNIPVRAGSEVRDVFVAGPGEKLIVSDYDNIEVRILAYYTGPEGQPYRDLINAGHDPHGWMAAQLWGGEPEDYAKGTDKADLRARAKNKCLFPIIYGAGGKKLCQENGLPTGPPLTANDWEVQRGYSEVGQPSCRQGKALAKAVKRAIPGYALLMKRIKDTIAARGYVTTIGGRRQAVAAEKSYVGMSALIQGSAADVMKRAMVLAEPALRPWRYVIRLTVHDEIVASGPEHNADRALAALQTAMEEAGEEYNLDPPLLTSGAICDRYGEAK